MKKVQIKIKIFISLLSLVALLGTVVKADEDEPDIRYRTIIYLFPTAEKLTVEDIPQFDSDFTRVEELPERADKPLMTYSLSSEFSDTYPVPDLNYLSYFGRGLSREQAELIQNAPQALIVDVAYPMAMSPEKLKLTSKRFFELAAQLNGLIWDSETRELFGLEAWKEKRVDSWVGDVPQVEFHTTVHVYNTGDAVRAISLGMIKFGLPDVVVSNFSWSFNKPMGNLINLVMQSLAEGNAEIGPEGLAIRIAKLHDTPYKRGLIASLKENAADEVVIQVGEGEWEEGDPYNFMLEILFDNYGGDSLSEKQDLMLSTLFGWEDSITYVEHNREIEAASARAREKLPALKRDFTKGLAPGEYIQVKTPFATPDGGNEWMWVEIMAWSGKDIKGLLKNEPFNIPNLKGGAEVLVNEDDVFDYIRVFPDGRSEGNETAELILKYQQ